MALTQVKTLGLADGTDGQILTYDANGVVTAVGPGSDGQVLTSTGAGSPPAFEAIPAAAVTALNNATANELVTVGSTTTELDAEAKLTFDGDTLKFTHDAVTNFDSNSQDFLVIENGDSDTYINIGTETNRDSGLIFSDDTRARGWYNYNHASDYAYIGTAGGERLRIDSSGRALIGHTAQQNHGGVEGQLQVIGTGSSDSSLNLTRFSADNWCPFLSFGKSRHATKGSHTVASDGDYIGYINFAPSDGNDFQNGAAAMYVQIDGTPGTNDTPGRMIFATSPDGTNSPTERLRIDSTGDVKINDGNLVIGTSGHGIDFSATANAGATGASMSSEVLDFYEEGTWTPVLQYYNGSNYVAVTFSNAADNLTGIYTRIGDIVHFQWYTGFFQLSAYGIHARIEGLPFITSNDDSGHSVANFTHCDCFTSTVTDGYISKNSTRIYAMQQNSVSTATWDSEGYFMVSGVYKCP